VLILAANTAFNGFPMLASILARDRYAPRQLYNRGDRLVYSNGVVLLALAAIALIIAFDAQLTRLIQLYIIGVFVSFTLSQAGMVRHWRAALAAAPPASERRRIHRSLAINAVGAALTALVLVIVLITKFTHGAWLVIIAMPLLFVGMKGVRRHYDQVADFTAVPADARPHIPLRNHVLVLVSAVHAPTLKALGVAQALRPTTLTAISVTAEPEEAAALQRTWDEHDLGIPLEILHSPYREVVAPVLAHIRRVSAGDPQAMVSVVIPEYVVGHWWEQPLHNQIAFRLKARLLFTPDVNVIDVPFRLAPGK
jgi:hypothetical protein